MNSKLITASIVLYNTNINQLNNAVASYKPSENRLLYLIDNSESKSIDINNIDLYKNVKYIFNGKNIGYGAGHNIAIRKALELNSDYHVVLNPDLEFKPEIIDKITDFMDKDENIAQIMPKIVNENEELQYLCKLLPAPSDLLIKRFLPDKIKEKYMKRYQLKFTNYNKIMNIPYLSGCFMFFRTSAFKTVGLFDERFFMYPEDIDITRRMHKYFKTIYYPEVSIFHIHAADSYKNIKMLMIHIINIIKYFNKWGWFYDKERKEVNKKVLSELGYFKMKKEYILKHKKQKTGEIK